MSKIDEISVWCVMLYPNSDSQQDLRLAMELVQCFISLLYHVIPCYTSTMSYTMWFNVGAPSYAWGLLVYKTHENYSYRYHKPYSHIVIEVIINQLSYHKSAINPMKSPFPYGFSYGFSPTFSGTTEAPESAREHARRACPPRCCGCDVSECCHSVYHVISTDSVLKKNLIFQDIVLQIWLKDQWWSMVKLTFSVEQFVKTCDFCGAKSRVQPVDKWHRPTWG